ncbi:DUF1574 family protein [bacterium]|nr:DUF1574 family protein [bacterium]QQR59906.1 MAG: DUF1574 family protein [Candidatus Melainabacteria bacterium]
MKTIQDEWEEHALSHEILVGSVSKPFYYSVFLLILFLLVSFDIFLGFAKPLKHVHVAGTMLKDQDIVGCRIEQLFDKSSHFNTIVLGDSTADDICVFPDVLRNGIGLNSYSRYYYLDCIVGESIIKKNLSLPVSLKNSSFGGSLVSDHLLFLQKLCIHGNPPKIAFIMVVPRPFLDTTIDTKISPVQCYFDNRFKTIEMKADIPYLIDSCLSKFSNFYRTRSDYATVCSAFGCSLFNRSVNGNGHGISQRNKLSLAGSEERVNPNVSARPDWILEETEHYKRAYAFESKTYDKQLNSFGTILTLLKERNIPTILVKMPLTEDNLKLLPDGFKKKFEKDLYSLVSKHGAYLFDFQEDKRFKKSDFLDNVHLNGNGAIKFWQVLANQMKEDSSLCANLAQSLNK